MNFSQINEIFNKIRKKFSPVVSYMIALFEIFKKKIK